MSKAINVRVAIVYHSGYGHTARHAQAVALGAATAGAEALLISVEEADAHWETLEQVDAIIFGCPTYMGSASAQFKMFMDASSRRAFLAAKWKDKLAAGFTNAANRSGDKLATLQQLAIFAAQHGMNWINLGLHGGHNSSQSSENTLNRHGFYIGAAAQSDVDVGADEGATQADLNTSAHLGSRVALAARQMAAGRAALAGQAAA